MHITSEARFTKIQENNVQIYVLVSISFFFHLPISFLFLKVEKYSNVVYSVKIKLQKFLQKLDLSNRNTY